MGRDPAFLFYPGDWLGGTLTFSRSHKGAYMDLLMAHFNQGRLSLDDIKTILGFDFESMWHQKLEGKFEKDKKGLYYNERLEYERDKRRKFSKSRRDNLASKPNSMEPHKEPYMENENETIDKDGKGIVKGDGLWHFDTFWDTYNYKVGKQDAEKAWDKLSEEEKEACVKAIPKYVAATPDTQFRKHPTTYLNGKHWNDEIIIHEFKPEQSAQDRQAENLGGLKVPAQ